LLGTCAWRPHRRAARPKGLDRAPGPSGALAPAARASSPLGDYPRRDPDCHRVDGTRRLSSWTFPTAGRTATAASSRPLSPCRYS